MPGPNLLQNNLVNLNKKYNKCHCETLVKCAILLIDSNGWCLIICHFVVENDEYMSVTRRYLVTQCMLSLVESKLSEAATR